MRAQSRPGKRARINLLCRMHACRWTLFVREKKTSFVVKAQRVLLRFVVLFFIIMRTTTFFCFSFFPFFFLWRRRRKKAKQKRKGKLCGEEEFYIYYFLSTPSPRIDLTDLSLSLSFGTKRGGKKKKKKKKKNAMTTREDDLYRALGIERTASQEEIRKAYKTAGTL